MADRKIGLAHFAFYRGWIEGVDLAELGDRYLLSGRHLPSAKRTRRWLQDEFIAAARRAKPPLARLLKLTPAQIARVEAMPTISLEDFQAEVDPEGFYSEKELLSLFEERFGATDPTVTRQAQRNERLIRRLREAVLWLEGWLAVDPVPDDPVAVWFDEPIAARLTAGGLDTLAALAGFLQRHGRYWYRRLAKIGPVTAARLQRWLAENRLLPTETLPVPAEQAATRGRRLEAAIVPIERLLVPDELTGAFGSNRVYSNKLAARNDFEAIQAWLRSVGTRPHTVRSYRGQAERFLLWMIFERQKPLSSATVEDCLSYRDFLDALDPDRLWFWTVPRERWIGARSTPRWREDWRPFAGPLAPTSQQQAIIILTALCEWLMRQRYLETNPWDGVASHYALPARLRADHSLTVGQWKTVIAATEPMPRSEKYYRLYLALVLAYGLGLRLSEIAAARIAPRQEQAGRANPGIKPAADGNGWDIEVVGKGRKLRAVPMPHSVVAALQRYGACIGLGEDLGSWPAGQRIFMTLGDGSYRVTKQDGYARQPMSESQIYRMFKSHFRKAAACVESATDAGHLVMASTHWLRHTHATHSLEAGAEIEEVQENLGHSSVAITAIYTHASRKRRKSAVEKLMAYSELS